jgi:hypothetical protein
MLNVSSLSSCQQAEFEIVIVETNPIRSDIVNLKRAVAHLVSRQSSNSSERSMVTSSAGLPGTLVGFLGPGELFVAA